MGLPRKVASGTMLENHAFTSLPFRLKVWAMARRSSSSPAVVACLIAAAMSSARLVSDIEVGRLVPLAGGWGAGEETIVGVSFAIDCAALRAVDCRYGTSGRGWRSATSAARRC